MSSRVSAFGAGALDSSALCGRARHRFTSTLLFSDPFPPKNVSVENVSTTVIQLKWEEPEGENGGFSVEWFPEYGEVVYRFSAFIGKETFNQEHVRMVAKRFESVKDPSGCQWGTYWIS